MSAHDILVRAAAPCSFRSGGQGADSASAGDGDRLGVAHGYASVYNVFTTITGERSGPFLERISPRAFQDTLVRDRSQIRALYEHGSDVSAGRRPLGPLTTLRSDGVGLYYEVALADTDFNRGTLVPLLRSGAVGDASFAFAVDSELWEDRPARSSYNPSGIPERTIERAKLYEISVVSVGAYQSASSSLKAA